MQPAVRPAKRRQGATRRQGPIAPASSRFDRWLDRLVSIAVVTATVVGGMAVLVTLFFD
ncbi:hypothetical protein [Salinicola aestuarinus]|uniref:hypothetical protein n=1 Tax=Salinicola aestuarinus TaxID=1949082 RepID=UPI001300BECC|nr:hypothetical protein [Salinicola aestuarinus]